MLTRSDGMFDYVCNCNETSHFVKLKFGRSPFPFTEKMFVALANEVSIFLLILLTNIFLGVKGVKNYSTKVRNTSSKHFNSFSLFR